MPKKSKPIANSNAKVPKKKAAAHKAIEPYEHRDKQRLNNPPVGLVNADSEPEEPRKTYTYDPHLDPSLQWAGKAERTSFDVPTVSLHVHERIDARTIIEAVRKQEAAPEATQLSLFAAPTENPPLREAIEFYKHRHNWSNRLIAGDSLLVMNSLLEKEGLGGQVQMIYLDPPYGIRYGSNFQPFVNKRTVQDGKDEDLSQEPEMIKAFRDTWELGIHSYLTYLRDRLLLSRELLSESGSVFVQISDENLHLVRCLMDEVLGPENFVSVISFSTTRGFSSSTISRAGDYLCWYAKDKPHVKYHSLYIEKDFESNIGTSYYEHIDLPDGTYRRITEAEFADPTLLPKGSKIVSESNLSAKGLPASPQPYTFNGKVYYPNAGCHWKIKHPEGLDRLAKLVSGAKGIF